MNLTEIRDHHAWFRQTRRIVEKCRDLEYPRKASRIFTLTSEHEPIIIDCLKNLKSYFECCFAGVFEDVRIDQAKARLLVNLDQLITEANSRLPRKRHLPKGYVKAVIVAHRDLFNLIVGHRIRLNDCRERWSKAVNAAVMIWGNRM